MARKKRNRGIQKRAKQRLQEIGPVGGVNPNDGISRPEARKVRRAWQTERQFNPNTPRNGRQIRRLGQTLTDLEYAPQERELERSKRSEQGRQNVMANWFQQYQDRVAQIARDNQIASQAYQQGAAQAAQQAFQMDTAGVGQRQAQAQQSASQYGAQADPSVALQAQQAAGGRLAQGTAFAGTLGQIGQAQTGLFNQLTAGAGQQRIETLADSNARIAEIERLGRELSIDKGRSLSSNIMKLQDSEHTKQLERSAFNLDVTQAQADIADDAADNRLDRRKDRRDAARDRLLNRQTRESIRTSRGKRALDRQADLADDGRRNNSTDYNTWADRNSASDGSGRADGFTPTQVRKNRSSFENGRDIAYRYRDKGYQWLYNSMVDKNYDSLMAKVIAMKATRKRIPASLLSRFQKRYGFRPSAKGKGPTGSHRGSLTPRNQDGTPG